MHIQVPKFKTSCLVDSWMFQNHYKRGKHVIFDRRNPGVQKGVSVGFKEVTASLFDKEDEMRWVALRNLLFTGMFLTFWPSGIFLKWNAKNVPESNKCLSFEGPSLCSWWGGSPLQVCPLSLYTPAQRTLANLLMLHWQHIPAPESAMTLCHSAAKTLTKLPW